MTDKTKEIQKRVQDSREDIIKFMREICAIPSMEGKIGPVGERIQAEMKKQNLARVYIFVEYSDR